MRRRHQRELLVFTAVAVLSTGGATTLAQAPGPPATQRFDVAVEVSGGYDSDAEGVVTPDFEQLTPSGYSTLAVGSLQYYRQFSEAQLTAVTGSALRYFPEFREVRTVGHTVAVGLDANVSKRLALRINQDAAYSPSYLYGLFPQLPPESAADATVVASPDYDYNIDDSTSYNYGTTAILTRSFSRRFSVNAQGEARHINFTNESDLRHDLTTYGVGGGLSRNLTRNTVLTADYHFRTIEGYAVGLTVGEHSVNAGIDLTRRVSARRSAQLSFKLGGSTINMPQFATETESGGRQFRVNADFIGFYPFARTWRLRGSYNRGVQYVGGLTQPAFVDGFTGEVGGLISRRVEFRAFAGRTSGQSLLASSRSLLDTYSGDVKISYSLSPLISVYGQYLYYAYDLGERVYADPTVPTDLQRNGVRIGFSLQVPVYRR